MAGSLVNCNATTTQDQRGTIGGYTVSEERETHRVKQMRSTPVTPLTSKQPSHEAALALGTSSHAGTNAAFARQSRIEAALARFPISERAEIRKSVAELEARGVNVVGIARASATGTSSLSFTFGSVERGIELTPGVGRTNEILCYVPPQYRARGVRAFECIHRQDAATERHGSGRRDPNPGMTCVNFRSIGDGSWRALLPLWGSHAPTPDGKARGAMFAEAYEPGEPGSGNNTAESDYRTVDMRGYRGSPTFTDIAGVEPPTREVRTDFIRISCPLNTTENGLYDPVWLHQLDVLFQPPAANDVVEIMFTPGAEFAPWGSAPCFVKYGGGQETDGTFGGSLELRPNGTGGAGAAALPTGAAMRPDGALEIDLTPWAGRVLAGVEVMAGDSKPDGKTNPDGGKGTSGWSVMSMQIETDAGTDRIIDEANVTPNGIVAAAPSHPNQIIEAGTKLVISAESKGEPPTEMDPRIYSVSYVPGLRLGFKEADQPEEAA